MCTSTFSSRAHLAHLYYLKKHIPFPQRESLQQAHTVAEIIRLFHCARAFILLRENTCEYRKDSRSGKRIGDCRSRNYSANFLSFTAIILDASVMEASFFGCFPLNRWKLSLKIKHRIFSTWRSNVQREKQIGRTKKGRDERERERESGGENHAVASKGE